MTKRTKVERLTQEFTPGIHTLIGYKITKADDESFVVPVVDVRISAQHRASANACIKATNKTKYLQPSYSVLGYSYNLSMKR